MSKRPAVRTPLERLIAPYPFFAGAALAFVACCLAGLVASRRDYLKNFVRFHRYIALETSFYPTASLVRNLAHDRLDPDRIAVIIGGNSVLNGVGQREEEVWTKDLQAQLGDRYRVLNLGMVGAQPQEFGGVAAEMLAAEYPRLLLVVDVGSTVGCGHREGERYCYFLWDAYEKGLLPPDPGRDAWVGQLDHLRRHDDAHREQRRGARLDSVLYFNDLWHMVAYTQFSTVWSSFVRRSVTWPRRRYGDDDKPFATRAGSYPPAEYGEQMAAIHTVIPERVPGIAYDAGLCFPIATRPRTLVLAVHDSPYYVDRLDPAEREKYLAFFPRMVRALEKKGFSALEIGADYPLEAFNDRCHLTSEGGRRMAREVAARLEEMAEQLGYTR